jgi:hypothetical protein
MQLGSMFIITCNNTLHVSDAICIHPQEHLKLWYIMSRNPSVVPTQTGTYSLLLLLIKEKEYDVGVPFNGTTFTSKLLKICVSFKV